MMANDYSAKVPILSIKIGGIYELRTYTAAENKLNALNSRFANHTTRIFTKHGMGNIGYWTPFDRPKSSNTLIYLLHHKSREEAEKNWRVFSKDPEFLKVTHNSHPDGKLCSKNPERLYLKPTDFSPLK